MSVTMIVRRKADHQDVRLVPLRREGIALLKKHGAISHSYGYYHSGAHAGQMFVAVGSGRFGSNVAPAFSSCGLGQSRF
jgi:hypothetical protein